MEKIRNGEDLRQRLVQTAGEDVIECGWGTLGMGNVFAGVTPSAVVLEFITLGMKTKDLQRISLDELEFIYAVKGDASTPGLLKLSLESRITDAMTGTLLLKRPESRLMSLKFRKIPGHERNDQAPFRIIEFLTSVKPGIVKLPDLGQIRERQSFPGCFRSFLLLGGICSVVISIGLGLGTGKWDMALFGGAAAGLVLGAVFAPLVPVFKRILSGRG